MSVSIKNKDKNQRTYDLPVMMTKGDEALYQRANLCIAKQGDMILESFTDAQPGSDILIRMEGELLRGPGLKMPRCFRARVMACREVLDEYTFTYMLRVRIYESL